MKQYVAVRKRGVKAQGRIVWRLYSSPGGLPACPLGDFSGQAGKSGLLKIKRSLESSGHTVVPFRYAGVTDQVTFTVYTGAGD